MTSVIATPTFAYVEVVESTGFSAVVEINRTATVELVTAGPQGPPGINIPVVSNAPTTGSVVYYDENSSIFRVDADHTFTTLTDGGNF